jgi:hypothetical protein
MGEGLEYASREFHRRHPATRALALLCVGRPSLVGAAVASLRGLMAVGDRLGSERAGSAALSGIFNLLYWNGICDELGDRRTFWQAIDEGASRPFRSAAIPRV